jgi:hypothetical protein
LEVVGKPGIENEWPTIWTERLHLFGIDGSARFSAGGISGASQEETTKLPNATG